jgi:hypothetical protein
MALFYPRVVGARPAAQRRSVMRQKRAEFPFHDFHSFKDYVGFVQLCAPDDFPKREGVSDADQWTLDLAYEGLQRGLQIAAGEGVKESVLSECRALIEKAFAFYRAGNLHDGFRAMEAVQRVLRRVPSR